MRLSINFQSLEALRALSIQLPYILDNLYQDTQNLMQLYYNMRTEIGPHEELYEEMLYSIERAQSIADDALRSISYQLSSVADQMEQYLLPYGTAGVMVRRQANDLKEEYQRNINQRVMNGEGNESILHMYQKWQSKIKILSDRYTETAHYDSYAGGIRLHAMEDMHHVTGSCSCYFHEVGHMIDDLAGKAQCSWISEDDKFLHYLKEDFQNYVHNVQLAKNCDKEQAYDIISEDLWNYKKSGVSDIFGSLSNCKCQGCWGHDRAYWLQRENMHCIEKEAFANMFEASIGDAEKLKMMKQYLPLSYGRFEELVKGGLAL